MDDNNDSDSKDEKPLELPIQKHPPRGNSNQITSKSSKQNEQTTSVFKPRDPRYDPKCSGSNDVRHFVRNYSFIDDIRQEEINQLKQALRKEKDPEKVTKIKNAISRIKNKTVERHNKAKKLELVDQAKVGHKNIKKSEIKKHLLVNKYKELKETGKLGKYLERKRKKLIQRDGKAFN